MLSPRLVMLASMPLFRPLAHCLQAFQASPKPDISRPGFNGGMVYEVA